jgi:hypothetical protein
MHVSMKSFSAGLMDLVATSDPRRAESRSAARLLRVPQSMDVGTGGA